MPADSDISEIFVKKNECKLAQNLVYGNEIGHIICDSFVSKEVNSKGERRRASNKQSIKKIKDHENGHQYPLCLLTVISLKS